MTGTKEGKKGVLAKSYAWFNSHPLNRAIALAVTICSAAMIMSSIKIYDQVQQYGVSAWFAVLTFILIDGFQIVLYIIVVAKKSSEEEAKTFWLWMFIGSAALLALLINVDYGFTNFTNPPDSWIQDFDAFKSALFVTIFGSLGPIVFFVTLKYLAGEYERHAREEEKPLSVRMYDYWYENEVENGKKVTAQQLASKFNANRRTVTNYLREWRTVPDSTSQHVNGTSVTASN